MDKAESENNQVISSFYHICNMAAGDIYTIVWYIDLFSLIDSLYL